MNEPIRLDPTRFFEFVARPGVAVIFLSVHPRHELNRALCDHFREAQGEQVAFGIVDLRELIVSASPALRFLHQAMRACGAPSSLGIVPGYLLFREGQLLAWNSGLPAGADLAAIARSALLGALWSGFTGRLAFMGEALYFAAQEATAERVAAAFRQAVTERAESRDGGASGASRPRASSRDDVLWAYQILGVHPSATEQEVRKAWRKRRAESHPDHAGGDPVEFERLNRISVEINQARDIILGHFARAQGSASA